jgi:hypothetical protein
MLSAFYALQKLLRLREKLVELRCRSSNVDEHRLGSDVHNVKSRSLNLPWTVIPFPSFSVHDLSTLQRRLNFF